MYSDFFTYIQVNIIDSFCDKRKRITGPSLVANKEATDRIMGNQSHLVVKCSGAVALLIVTVICGIIPIKLIRLAKSKNSRVRKENRMKLFVGCCNCFAGGVFFSICLLDLLPEVREKMVSALSALDVHTTYPLGEWIASVGFVLMVFTEILVHSLGKGTMLMDHMHHHDGPSGEEEPLMRDEQDDHSYGTTHQHIHHNCHQQKQADIFAIRGDNGEETPLRHTPHPIVQDSQQSPAQFVDDKVVIKRSITPPIQRSKSLRSISAVNTVVHSSFRMYILIIALSLHSFFEGLSFGLITDVDMLVQLLVALLLHKSILSFALGIKLVDGGMQPRFIIKGIIIFSAMAPLGVGIGLAVLSSSSRVASLFCSGILQGLATGSFLYVTFFEILPEEFTLQSRNKGLKLLSVIIGFLVISGMCYYDHQFKNESKKANSNPKGDHFLPSTVATLLK